MMRRPQWKPPPVSARTAAQASTMLTKRGVGPLLKFVGGKEVERELSASPESSSAEDEDEDKDKAKGPQPQSDPAVSLAHKRKEVSAVSESQPVRKARAAPSRRQNKCSTIDSADLPGAPKTLLDDEAKEDDRHFWALRDSQARKLRTYGSQESQNIHAPARSTNKAKPLGEQKSSAQTSGFKRPRPLAEENDSLPRPAFKRPASLAESPRSSITNTFRDPRSSPPQAIAIYSSSAAHDTDDSPLSSPPPSSSPDNDAATDVQPVLSNGILVVPCPLCRNLVPQAFLESFNDGESLRWTDKVAFCQAHKEQEAKAQRSKQQYPTIDWAALPARMSKFHTTIEAILERRKDSYYRNMLDESVATGQERNAFRAVEGAGQAHAVPGYYGMKGARAMQEHILATFSTRIRRLASTDKAIPRTGPAGYVQTVLAPEMAVLLVMDDFAGIDAEQARTILAESVEVGKLLPDADEEVERAKSFVEDDS